ncbi:MAG: hypothetical protein KBT63_10630 [Porticoccaceae bacterium]|nr:hypothetical protein [Porticoccaceae bacterium]
MSAAELELEASDNSDELFQSAQERRRVIISSTARRRLEDKLEQRRLEKAIQEYDFDLD